MKVLLSINPEYVEKIFSGVKKYEYRRSIFKEKNIKTIVIYCTYPVKKIVGEFDIEDVIKDTPEKLWNLAPNNTGIEKNKFLEYFEKKDQGYAIKIGKIKKYKIPKRLEEICVKRAPQSFQYID
ncbi:hypothetical protein QCB49_16480 (plasmid) [Cetobacterium somerae]|uniref:ASCH domain-containing protein n=1 Tax=Cetobacterium somerae TaxID=188913 RepID=UPI00389123F2